MAALAKATPPSLIGADDESLTQRRQATIAYCYLLPQAVDFH